MLLYLARICYGVDHVVNRAAVCDVTGGVASLTFDATELQIFKGNLGSARNPNLQYGHF